MEKLQTLFIISLWKVAFVLLLQECILSVESSIEDERSIGTTRRLENTCPCQDSDPWTRPDVWKKAETARWMVHSIEWGVLTTLSSRTILSTNTDDDNNDASLSPPLYYPFGNVYSFIDGPCNNATGTPYFYGSFMDQSLKDIIQNPAASLTLSEASLASSACWRSDESVAKACSISSSNIITAGDKHRDVHGDSHKSPIASEQTSGDPESPLCARLTLTGTLVQIPTESDEFETLQRAFYQRHAQMELWPKDHEWVIFALQIHDVWLIDYFGGASILTPNQYYAVNAPVTRNSNE